MNDEVSLPVKHLQETFSEEEFERLRRAKGDMSWHDFILSLAEDEREQ